MTNNLSKELFTSIAPETEALNAAIVEIMGKGTPWHELEPSELRRRLKEEPLVPPPPKSERAKERKISGPAGDITLRQIVPDSPVGVYLHIHGGGWVVGSADGQDLMLEEIADSCNL